MPAHPIILAIESSCDDTGAAVLAGGQLLSNVVATQKVHEQYGGVVPELASRAHQQHLLPVVTAALREAGLTKADLDAVAVTQGPGLLGSLLVGGMFAKTLALALDKPLLAVNHMRAHILAHFLRDPKPEFPFLCLTVSGGHTQLVVVKSALEMEVIGQTIDDAAGEAFDKSAKLMGLGYPGGPALSKLAEQGDATAFKLPRPLLHSGNLDFSFAGLKTAVLTQAKKLGDELEPRKADLAASTEAAIVEVLVKKTLAALKQTGMKRVVVAGGVGANRHLRNQLNEACAKNKVRVHYPELHLCTDNGAMIAMAAAMRLESGQQEATTEYAFDVKPRWPLDLITAATA